MNQEQRIVAAIDAFLSEAGVSTGKLDLYGLAQGILNVVENEAGEPIIWPGFYIFAPEQERMGVWDIIAQWAQRFNPFGRAANKEGAKS